MPLYEMTAASFAPLKQESFAGMGIRERDDLQRLLRSQIEVIGEDLYVLAEEFGDWEDSRRRIDLLAIDRQANLVVIELKRTHDGGHMELQAIRYASMISAMTFERAEQIHTDFLKRMGEPGSESRNRLLTFLGWEEPEEEDFGRAVRIILVSEDFGKELTTAVLWLRDQNIDIQCVRLRPYQDGKRKLVDVHVIIPLPEAYDYQVQIQKKQQVESKGRARRHDERFRFWEGLVEIARSRNTRHAGIKPNVYSWLGAGSGIRGLGFNYTIGQERGVAELYIDRGNGFKEENKRIFDQLYTRKEEVERLFRGKLLWERLDEKQACRIKSIIERGGYRSSESEWPEIQSEMVDTMSRLETALESEFAALEI